MKSRFSRRKFLKYLGGIGGFLVAEVSGLIPEIQLNAMDDTNAQQRLLGVAERKRLRRLADRNTNFKQLQDYLSQRGFNLRADLVEAIRFQDDKFAVDMLMTGFDGLGKGASSIFVTGTSEGKVVESSFVWIVNEEAYINKQNAIVPFPEGTERMQNVPRLPQQDDTTSSALTRPVYADQCPCYDLWSECYVYNALCASLTAGCAVGCVPCCAAAVGACITAVAKCFKAQQCGPPC